MKAMGSAVADAQHRLGAPARGDIFVGASAIKPRSTGRVRPCPPHLISSRASH
jgi:hypothetical protein